MRAVHVPRHLVDETARALMGRGERTALWQFTEPADGVMIVRRIVTPAQESIQTSFGHLVHVTGVELARVQLDAYRLGFRTWVQLHTHPGSDVRMSDTDREWAIADFPGALSIIVPHFGRNGLIGWPGVAVHERHEAGWHRWTRREILANLVVV